MTNVRGLIAAENQKTSDGRIVSGFDWRPGDDSRVPVMYLTESDSLGGHFGARDVIGWFEVIAIVRGLVIGEGEVEWPAPNHLSLFCGVDTDQTQFVDLEEGDEGMIHIVGGRLRAVTLYSPDIDMIGAWPFTQVWRVES